MNKETVVITEGMVVVEMLVDKEGMAVVEEESWSSVLVVRGMLCSCRESH